MSPTKVRQGQGQGAGLKDKSNQTSVGMRDLITRGSEVMMDVNLINDAFVNRCFYELFLDTNWALDS